jgi:hypothetical protein
MCNQLASEMEVQSGTFIGLDSMREAMRKLDVALIKRA